MSGNQHTRIAWLQGGDRLNGGGKLWGYDSRDNQARLIPGEGRRRPVLCSGGHSVAVTQNGKTYEVDWTSGSKRYVVDGACSEVWLEPSTGQEWVFVMRSKKLYRHKLSDPAASSLVWDKTDMSGWWQVSGDGALAVEFCPWPDGPWVFDNAATSTNGNRTKMDGDGCWASVASDNSHYRTRLNWPHHTVAVHKDMQFIRDIAPNFRHPEGDGKELYHPRFTAKGSRFYTITAGYPGNTGSSKAEIFVGRFNAACDGWDGWTRVTNDTTADYFPDAWVGVEARRPAITVRSPNGGASYQVGDTVMIGWETTGNIPGVTIEVSADNGRTWLNITTDRALSPADATWENYPWVVPDRIDGQSLLSDQVLVRGADYFNAGSVNGRSDGPFAVRSAATVSSPGHNQSGARTSLRARESRCTREKRTRRASTAFCGTRVSVGLCRSPPRTGLHRPAPGALSITAVR